MTGWVHAEDLSSAAPEQSEPLLLVGDLAGLGPGMCIRSHPPAESFVVLRRGAPLFRGADDARPFARATSEGPFVVTEDEDGWLAIMRAPAMTVGCPPLARVRASDVVERRARD
jgi:hypothetical protein